MSSEYRWINTARLLSEVSAIAAPNDIRQVVSFVSSAQRSPEAVQRDLAEYRRVCLVEMEKGSHSVVTMTLRSGAAFRLRFDERYPEVSIGFFCSHLSLRAHLPVLAATALGPWWSGSGVDHRKQRQQSVSGPGHAAVRGQRTVLHPTQADVHILGRSPCRSIIVSCIVRNICCVVVQFLVD